MIIRETGARSCEHVWEQKETGLMNGNITFERRCTSCGATESGTRDPGGVERVTQSWRKPDVILHCPDLVRGR